MKESPIIFSMEMVKAILDGRKCQTRRVLKQELPIGTRWWEVYGDELNYRIVDEKSVKTILCKCPYGKKGDKLWVRESWNISRESNPFRYKADYPPSGILKWKPSIHMPKVAARIWLEVVSVRVERLIDISQEDCVKEGFDSGSAYGTAKMWFHGLWDKIHGDASWAANPWVWVVEFKKM